MYEKKEKRNREKNNYSNEKNVVPNLYPTYEYIRTALLTNIEKRDNKPKTCNLFHHPPAKSIVNNNQTDHPITLSQKEK